MSSRNRRQSISSLAKLTRGLRPANSADSWPTRIAPRASVTYRKSIYSVKLVFDCRFQKSHGKLNHTATVRRCTVHALRGPRDVTCASAREINVLTSVLKQIRDLHARELDSLICFFPFGLARQRRRGGAQLRAGAADDQRRDR